DRYPWHTLPVLGGTFGPAAGEGWRNYLAASNELNTPKIVLCPSERTQKKIVTEWSEFTAVGNRDNCLSYFTGLDAYEKVSASLLAGDRNIGGGKPDTCESVSLLGVN